MEEAPELFNTSENEKHAQFNMSMGLTINLWRYMTMADDYEFEKKYTRLYNTLSILQNNVYPFMDSKESDDTEKIRKKLIPDIKIIEMMERKKKSVHIKDSLIEELKQWNYSLRKIMLKHGLLMPIKKTQLEATNA